MDSAMVAETQDQRNGKEGFLIGRDIKDSPKEPQEEPQEEKATSRLDGNDGFAVATSTSWNFEGLNREREGAKIDDAQLVNRKESLQNKVRREEKLPEFEVEAGSVIATVTATVTATATATTTATTTYCSVATQTIDFGAESGNLMTTGPGTIEGAEVKANHPEQTIQVQSHYYPAETSKDLEMDDQTTAEVREAKMHHSAEPRRYHNHNRPTETSKDLEMDDPMNAEVTESSFFEEPLQIPEIPHLEESIRPPEMSYCTTDDPREGQPQLHDILDIAQASQTPLPASPQAEEAMQNSVEVEQMDGVHGHMNHEHPPHGQVPPPPQQQQQQHEFDAASMAGTHISDDSWTGHVNMAARENLAIDSDLDSALGDMDTMSSTMSLRSSLYESIEENGRTYHRYRQGKYFLPNDETEQDRLDLQHQLFLMTFENKLHLAPIPDEKLQNVLDIGTGTGIWAIDFASAYPHANVLGTDLSPIQPMFVPPNCRFEVDDAEDEWTYSTPFDLIHGRALVTCFRSPPAVIRSAFDHLHPGGYLELQDLVMPMRGIDDSYNGTPAQLLNAQILEAATKMGLDFTHSSRYKQYMEAAGFVDVTVNHFQWPMGPWAKGRHMKILGLGFQQDILGGVEGLALAMLTRSGVRTAEQVRVELVGVRKTIMDRNVHAYMPGVVVYGRKP